MSMRSYGVQSKCMVLRARDFYNLIKEQGKIENGLFDFMYDEKGILNFEEIELSDFFDISYNITNACFFGEITGELCLYDENGLGKSEYYEDEVLMIFELEKDTLFKCYNNFDEIYDELIGNLKEVGINITKDFVKKHFGLFEGAYYG